MIIIHQRKSAGSALLSSLSRDLNVPIGNDKSSISPINAYGRELYNEIESYEGVKEPITSFHLHPTEKILNWMESWGGKAIILLRDPESSNDALSRHREVGNNFVSINRAYEGDYLSKRLNSLECLREFNHNWRTLSEKNNLLFIKYDEVVADYSSVLKKVCIFYDIFDKDIITKPLEKVRYSGFLYKKPQFTDLSKTRAPFFNCYVDDFNLMYFLIRKRKELKKGSSKQIFNYPLQFLVFIFKVYYFLKRLIFASIFSIKVKN